MRSVDAQSRNLIFKKFRIVMRFWELNQKRFSKKSINEGKLKRKNRIFLSSNSVETVITSWIWDMYETKLFISDELIQEKARRIQ